jgi:hypothetical protein
MNFSSDFISIVLFQACPCEERLVVLSAQLHKAKSSSAEEGDKWSICLETLTTQEVGIPNACNHACRCTY